MARSFNGTSDVIKASIGNLSALTCPVTYAAVVRKGADAVNGAAIRVHDSGGTLFYGGLQFNTSNVLRFFGASGTASSAFTVTAAEDWLVVAGSKTSGTTTPRFHKQVVSTKAWTHSDGDIAVTDVGTPGGTGQVWFGANGTPTWLNGDLAACAAYDYVLTDAQVELLGVGFLQWLKLKPVGLWLFDQASTGTSVTDLTGGGANQASITGTTVTTGPAAPLPVIQTLGGAGAG